MAYCRKCGAELDNEAVICPHCGVQQKDFSVASNDSGSIGWAILGFFIPIVGIILWLVWMDSKPKCSKMAGIGALISIGLGILFWVLTVVFAISFGLSN